MAECRIEPLQVLAKLRREPELVGHLGTRTAGGAPLCGQIRLEVRERLKAPGAYFGASASQACLKLFVRLLGANFGQVQKLFILRRIHQNRRWNPGPLNEKPPSPICDLIEDSTKIVPKPESAQRLEGARFAGLSGHRVPVFSTIIVLFTVTLRESH
jgi:hypothetical protein